MSFNVQHFIRAGVPVLLGLFFVYSPDASVHGAAPQNPQTVEADVEVAPSSDVVELGGRPFVTRDGVLMTGAYYKGNGDKETVPVVLLHSFGKDRHEFDPLVPELQNRGFAIIIPDLRGHGKSVKRFEKTETVTVHEEEYEEEEPRRSRPMGGPLLSRNRNQGSRDTETWEEVQTSLKLIDYQYENFNKRDIEAMMTLDTVPFQRFLVEANNAEHLNLKKLVIIGVDSGGSVGAFWVKSDWGGKHKCTKSFIVVSPSCDTIAKRIFNDPKIFRDGVSVSFFVGERNQVYFDNATELRNEILGKEKEKFPDYAAAETKIPITALPSELHGGELLSREKLKLPQTIADTIETKLAELKEKDLKWKRM